MDSQPPEPSPGSPLPSTTPAPDDATATVAPPAHLPKKIGEYRIIRSLGAGGMGIVYEAEQQQPKRPVAIKVIRGGSLVDDTQIRMFRREIQTLARLKHPGIAAIYESGCTPDGLHFFAMELVRGETLGQYLARRGADGVLTPGDVEERLEIFRKICDAIAYAHQRSIIHRDLKPANVLVLRDASTSTAGTPGPEIKILDFGLARITDSDLAASTVLTDLGTMQGTLPYMSPEQIRGNVDEIDLRTDVYSLGVMLYEMLSGRLPQELQRLPWTEAARVICDEPPQPLARTWRGTRKLDADLATIVHKALDKDPQRRYQSVGGLSDDLQRYRSNQPILARPPSTMYQLRKLVSRHKAVFTFVVSLALLLAAFTVVTIIQSSRIARERDIATTEAHTAKEVSDFLMTLFRDSDPFAARGNTITARELLDHGAQRLERELHGQPLLQARMLETIGNVYVSLDLTAEAQPLLLNALAIRERELDPEDPELARSLGSLGSLYLAQHQLAESRGAFARALAILEQRYGPDSPEVAWGLYGLRGPSMMAREFAQGRDLLMRAVRIFERHPSEKIGLSWCLNDLGFIGVEEGDYAGALSYFEQALALKRQALDPAHPDLDLTLGNIGRLLSLLGEYERAQPILEQVLRANEKVWGPEHPITAEALVGLGEMWQRRGEGATARPLVERAIAIHERLGPASWDLAGSRSLLAAIRREAQEFAAAESLFQAALAVQSSRPLHPAHRASLAEYATLLRLTGRPAAAAELTARADSLGAAASTRGSGM